MMGVLISMDDIIARHERGSAPPGRVTNFDWIIRHGPVALAVIIAKAQDSALRANGIYTGQNIDEQASVWLAWLDEDHQSK